MFSKNKNETYHLYSIYYLGLSIYQTNLQSRHAINRMCHDDLIQIIKNLRPILEETQQRWNDAQQLQEVIPPPQQNLPDRAIDAPQENNPQCYTFIFHAY